MAIVVQRIFCTRKREVPPPHFLSSDMPSKVGIRIPRDSSIEAAKLLLHKSTHVADQTLAQTISKENKWRVNYYKHLVRHAELMATDSKVAVQMAREGMKCMYDNFLYISTEGSAPVPLSAIQSVPPNRSFHIVEVVGSGAQSFSPIDISIPYQGKILTGPALQKQAQCWGSNGVMEGSAVTSLLSMSQAPVDARGINFIALGAFSEMGPTLNLLKYGATVLAIDLPRPAQWKELITFAKQSPGKLIFPCSEAVSNDADSTTLAQHAGANLVEQLPDILHWIKQIVAPGGRLGCKRHHNGDDSAERLVLGNYVYADGTKFFQVVAAVLAPLGF